MSEPRSEGLKGSISSYFQSFHEVAAHIHRGVGFFRIVYDRVRAPRTLPRAFPRPIRTVLFVCKANICRSPLAEVYFREKARKEGRLVSVKSAGVETQPGRQAHKLAKEIARQQGISLESHTATILYQELMEHSDLVLVMEVAQRDRVMKLYPQDRHKVFLLGQFCKSGSLDIADPYQGTKEDFEVCFKRIQESCDRVMQQLVGDGLSEVGTAEQKSEAKEQDE